MRRLIAVAMVLAACGGTDRQSAQPDVATMYRTTADGFECDAPDFIITQPIDYPASGPLVLWKCGWSCVSDAGVDYQWLSIQWARVSATDPYGFDPAAPWTFSSWGQPGRCK